MRVALYTRVSTGRQVEYNISIPDQIDAMKQWCERNGHEIVKEYTEEGHTGTNDKRPVFQRMVADACSREKSPFDLIVVHSLSRFFRDEAEMTLLVRRLEKHKVELASVTQEGTNNKENEMLRRVLALIDEQNSKENAKHTLRCMKRNAENGYYNGSHVPFGYRLHHTDIPARMGVKKRLVIDPLEAPLVKRIFSLYIERDLGVKGIASMLNSEGITRRGAVWSNTSVYAILTATVYMGQKLFNQRRWRTGEKKDDDEIVRIPVDSLVSVDTFELVREKLQSRSPKKSHPRRLSSPHLLTGILRCGECGAAMTMATGKSNQYFYYRCTTRTKKHLDLCPSKMVSMGKLDSAVMSALADKVFTPERVTVLLRELKSRMRGESGENIAELNKQADTIRFKLTNLYRSIEDGIAVDDILRQRLDQLKTQEQELSKRIENFGYSPQAVVESIVPEEVKAFAAQLREKLLSQDSKFTKEYLKLLVREVELKENQATVRGSYCSLVGAIKIASKTKNLSTSQEVLRFNGDWRAWRDSNSRPTDS